MSEGFIKLRRGLRGHWITQDPQTLSVFIHLLMFASYKDQKVMSHGKLVELKRGQLRTSIRQISEATGVDRSAVARRLKLLESEQVIETRKTYHYTLITLTKYDSEQDACDTKPPTNQPTNQPTDQPPYKKIKKIKKGRSGATPSRIPRYALGKTAYREYPLIFLTDEEREKLKTLYLKEELSLGQALRKLQSWFEQNPTKHKNSVSHYQSMRDWVMRWAREQQTAKDRQESARLYRTKAEEAVNNGN